MAKIIPYVKPSKCNINVELVPYCCYIFWLVSQQLFVGGKTLLYKK